MPYYRDILKYFASSLYCEFAVLSYKALNKEGETIIQ